jgi:hypothetical protein
MQRIHVSERRAITDRILILASPGIKKATSLMRLGVTYGTLEPVPMQPDSLDCPVCMQTPYFAPHDITTNTTGLSDVL